ncbi:MULTISPECIES: hypothetical protein [Streptomyces]|uniref:hypothetical protein n=1 Tax=Streptomyces TaxID=1883 RepID=UPI0014889FA3|nr:MULTISPECIES: hypothetical protein [Streptomyces]
MTLPYDVVVVGGAVAGEFAWCPWLGIALVGVRGDVVGVRGDVGRGGSEAGMAILWLLDGRLA